MSREIHDVFVTRTIPLDGIRVLEDECDYRIWSGPEDGSPDQATILEEVRNCRVLLSLLTEKIDRPILEANESLLGVANYAVGFDNIEIETATSLGIPVTNTPGILTETTADLAWVLLMAVARRIPEAHNYTMAGKYNIWSPSLLLGEDIGPGPRNEPKTLGIVGYGRIGRGVHRRATGFSMRVLAYDPWAKDTVLQSEGVEYADFPHLLEQSDFVTLHCNLTQETHHLIGRKELERMKNTAYLVNTSRGPVIDEKALVWALKNNKIAGAGLDVYEEEPKLAEGLAELRNVVLLPHVASASRATRGEMAIVAARNALALLRKERAPNTVNPDVYDTEAFRKRIG
ncbi:MAG: D-glycerate dehydrogenase [Candidatus Neomarinimicrobiota bacterium]